MSPCIAVIGAGAMGSALAARLTGCGARVLTSLTGRSPASRARARDAGMADAPLDAIAGADLILSIVPPAAAGSVALELAPSLAESARKAVFVDCNAINPESKRGLQSLVSAAGCSMLDACIIGAPPGSEEADPRLFISGQGACDALILRDLGLDVRVLEGPVGAAAALKMCYAGINKGLTALTAAMLLAAERAGAAQALHEEMADSLPYLLARSRRSIPAMYPKAGRWVAEMREIAGFLEDDEAAAMMFEGAARFFEQRAADFAGDRGELGRLQRIRVQP